jgi:hypothetical protein
MNELDKAPQCNLQPKRLYGYALNLFWGLRQDAPFRFALGFILEADNGRGFAQ